MKIIKAAKLVFAGIVRGVFIFGGLFFMYMEGAANWFISYNKKTEYIRKGKCKKCGKCCQVLGIQYPNFFNRFPRLLKLTTKWHEYRYCFSYLNREGNYLLYRCNLSRPDGRCGWYHFRPRLCREYPKTGLFGKPFMHRTCGFYYTRRDGKPTFDEALHRADEKLSK